MTTGTLSKMISTLGAVVEYKLPLSGQTIDLNSLIGKPISLRYTGNIFCQACGDKTRKSYSQGYCFTCSQKLARCDMCILKPHTCHFANGTCREPEWGNTHCMTDHVVYLANTSSLKVGITRVNQMPTRWIDQGASQALPILKVKNRYLSGLVEVAISEFLADKTNWRTMLKGENAPLDLAAQARQILPKIDAKIYHLRLQHGIDAVEPIHQEMITIRYPVTSYPTAISSLNFDKDSLISSTLQGIKGQYLIFDSGVINIRKFTGYEVIATV